MRKILLLAAVAALWSSCSDNEICVSKPGEIRISPILTQLVPSADDTRTSFSATGKAAWANGDAIGLYCTQASATNVQFTASGADAAATWSTTTPIFWFDGTTPHKFLAYYPYASGNTDPALVKIPALNSQTGTLSAAQDFLYSNDQNTTGALRPAGAVALTFTHAFTLIELKFVLGGGLTAGTTLTNFVIAGTALEKIYTTDAASTIALASGTITAGATTNTATITPSSAPVLTATPQSLYTLILPGTYSLPLGPTLTVTFKDGNTTSYTTTPLALGTSAFLVATKYTYTVTLSRNVITISNPTITDWTPITGTPLNPTI